jgi:hypothetical protein
MTTLQTAPGKLENCYIWSKKEDSATRLWLK